MDQRTPRLSVVIISHNQREVLRRCIDSVLAQQTTFPVEIIVSDDRSTDGTREMLLSEYKDTIIPTFFNSDECDTTFTLERASYNRLNGLKLVTGNYLINIDGDDFYTSTDLFQTMVDTLEAHPECSLCCQNYCMVDANHVDAPHVPQNSSAVLQRAGILSGELFLSQAGYLPAACFITRNRQVPPAVTHSEIAYDDNTITARAFADGGMVAIVPRCDFVYVQYGNSSSASMTEKEKSILFLPEINLMVLAPHYANIYILRNLGAFSFLSGKVLRHEEISDRITKYFSKSHTFILSHLCNNVSFADLFRYYLIYLWTKFMFASHLKNRFTCRVLYRLAIGKMKQ